MWGRFRRASSQETAASMDHYARFLGSPWAVISRVIRVPNMAIICSYDTYKPTYDPPWTSKQSASPLQSLLPKGRAVFVQLRFKQSMLPAISALLFESRTTTLLPAETYHIPAGSSPEENLKCRFGVYRSKKNIWAGAIFFRFPAGCGHFSCSLARRSGP